MVLRLGYTYVLMFDQNWSFYKDKNSENMPIKYKEKKHQIKSEFK